MMENDALGYYEILKSSVYSDDEEIKQNYRKEAKLWHPDSNTSDLALDNFQKISVAYDVLKDREKRLTYDLLSQIYRKRNFPEMFSLKIYKNQKNQFDLGLKNIRLTKIVSKLYKCNVIIIDEVCNFEEAQKIVFKISIWNWLFGWWSLQGFIKNFQAISRNINQIDKNISGNFRILVHNALAYNQENQKKEARLYAIKALDYANDFQKQLINSFLSQIEEVGSFSIKKWNYSFLKALQLVLPSIFLFFIAFSLIKNGYVFEKKQDETDKIKYYQQVKHEKGDRGFDDVIVSQIFDIPVDVENDKMLYNFKDDSKALHGPDKKFDVLRKVDAKTTVRLTGYSPDGVWYRIMFDDGIMGFVTADSIVKGIGKSIPRGSKISYPREN